MISAVLERQREPPRSLRGSGAARSGLRGRGLGGRHRPPPPTPWRHTYATSLVRRGEDIHVVQRLMGHSNIATTTRYLYLSDADLLAAIDRAFPES